MHLWYYGGLLYVTLQRRQPHSYLRAGAQLRLHGQRLRVIHRRGLWLPMDRIPLLHETAQEARTALVRRR